MGINPSTAYAGAAAACLAAAGLAAWGAVAPSSEVFGETLRHTDLERSIALTFDDGPNPRVTPGLLDLLERQGVRATFFLIGKFVREAPKLAEEIVLRGHCVGNHTDTHPSLIFLPPAAIREELRRCEEAIRSATRVAPKWMRPPFGFRSPFLNTIVRARGVQGVVMWSRTARDWEPQPAERVMNRLQRVRAGDIVLLHDGDHRTLRGDRGHVVTALENWLPRWNEAGLRFVTLHDFGQDERSREPEAPLHQGG
jgi:peptidoglycan-N-acetylglucosamine deacetylase